MTTDELISRLVTERLGALQLENIRLQAELLAKEQEVKTLHEMMNDINHQNKGKDESSS